MAPERPTESATGAPQHYTDVYLIILVVGHGACPFANGDTSTGITRRETKERYYAARLSG